MLWVRMAISQLMAIIMGHYTVKKEAQRAQQQLHNYSIKPGTFHFVSPRSKLSYGRVPHVSCSDTVSQKVDNT